MGELNPMRHRAMYEAALASQNAVNGGALVKVCRDLLGNR